MSMIHTIRTLVAAATVASATFFAANAASADSFERWVYVTNESEWAIEAIHIANVDDPRWGPNLIRGYEIFPGEYTEVEPLREEGYCRFDVLMVFDDGYEMTLPGVNLCEATDIFTDGYDYDVYYI